MENLKILKIKGNSFEKKEDFLVEEVPITIIANDSELVTLLCSPTDIEDLVTGFLFTSGLVINKNDLKSIQFDKKRLTVYVQLIEDAIMKGRTFKRIYTSGCGKGTLFYNAFDLIKREKNTSGLKISQDLVFALMKDFQNKSHLFKKTGGVHSAALADNTTILVFRDDIGRHNAIDKVIGFCFNKAILLKDKILVTSGRISSDVLFKAQKAGFPIIISKSAPTNQAVKLAQDFKITLAGFVRGQSMNIYSEPGRIDF